MPMATRGGGSQAGCRGPTYLVSRHSSFGLVRKLTRAVCAPRGRAACRVDDQFGQFAQVPPMTRTVKQLRKNKLE